MRPLGVGGEAVRCAHRLPRGLRGVKKYGAGRSTSASFQLAGLAPKICVVNLNHQRSMASKKMRPMHFPIPVRCERQTKKNLRLQVCHFCEGLLNISTQSILCLRPRQNCVFTMLQL